MATLLVIDDDKAFLELLGVHLRSAGHVVRSAADAADGIHAILAEQPDLILLDISMPYLDGLELLRALRSDSATRDVPVILLTAHADEDNQAKARQLGADDFLSKPIHLEELVASIDKALSKARVTPAQGSAPQRAFS